MKEVLALGKNVKGRKALLLEIDGAIRGFDRDIGHRTDWTIGEEGTLVLLKCFKFVFENQ